MVFHRITSFAGANIASGGPQPARPPSRPVNGRRRVERGTPRAIVRHPAPDVNLRGAIARRTRPANPAGGVFGIRCDGLP